MHVRTVNAANASEAKTRATIRPDPGAGISTANMTTNLTDLQRPNGKSSLNDHIKIVRIMEK
jgi:hypothetical protein